jgi:hypothetical protein
VNIIDKYHYGLEDLNIGLDTKNMSSMKNISADAKKIDLHRSGKGSVADEWRETTPEYEKLKQKAFESARAVSQNRP